MDYVGKTAIVTGSSRGLGFAIARALLDKGCNVCISGVTQKNGDVALGLLGKDYPADRFMFAQCDIANEEHVEALFTKTIEKYKAVDILINSAAIVSEARWEQVINANLIGVIRLTYLGLKYMDKNNGGKGGVIVNVGSDSCLAVVDWLPTYCASKFGLRGFSEAVAGTSQERYGVRLNVLCPGWITTDTYQKMTDPANEADIFYGPGGRDKCKQSQKDDPKSSPEEVAACCLQLVEDQTINARCMLVMGQEKGLVAPATDLDPMPEMTPIFADRK